jgi:diacylglycerol O-acyltransferase
MDELKASKQGLGAATLAAVNELAPPAVLAQSSRLQFSTRLFNLLVTNIPGPQFPLYVLGRRLLDLFPVAFLPENHALAIAILSYDGGIDFGLLGDWDALPDIDVIAEGLRASLEELLVAARDGHRPPHGGARRANGSPARPEPEPEPEPARAAAGVRAPSGNGNGAPPSPVLPSGGPRPTQGPAADMRAKRQQSARRRPRGKDSPGESRPQ